MSLAGAKTFSKEGSTPFAVLYLRHPQGFSICELSADSPVWPPTIASSRGRQYGVDTALGGFDARRALARDEWREKPCQLTVRTASRRQGAPIDGLEKPLWGVCSAW